MKIYDITAISHPLPAFDQGSISDNLFIFSADMESSSGMNY
jgi:hypothetical protein